MNCGMDQNIFTARWFIQYISFQAYLTGSFGCYTNSKPDELVVTNAFNN